MRPKLSVTLPAVAYKSMLSEMIRSGGNETGGVLMGFFASERWVVTQIIGPGPGAKHFRESFIPDYEFQESEIARIFEASGSKEIYLGDWHTHPGAASYLSRKDKQVLKNIAHFEEARISLPLMMVLGGQPKELKCWYYRDIIFSQGVIKSVPVLLISEAI